METVAMCKRYLHNVKEFDVSTFGTRTLVKDLMYVLDGDADSVRYILGGRRVLNSVELLAALAALWVNNRPGRFDVNRVERALCVGSIILLHAGFGVMTTKRTFKEDSLYKDFLYNKVSPDDVIRKMIVWYTDDHIIYNGWYFTIEEICENVSPDVLNLYASRRECAEQNVAHYYHICRGE